MPYEPSDGLLIRYHCECDDCLTRGGAIYFFVGSEAPVFKFKTITSKQKDRHVMTGMGELRELDACSFVPSINESDPYAALAQELFDKHDDRWQRSLNRERVSRIGRFWTNVEIAEGEDDEHGRGHIVNNIVLGLTKDNHTVYPDGPEEYELELGESWFAESCTSCNTTVDQILENEGEDEGKNYVQRQITAFREAVEAAGEWKVFADHCPKKGCPNHKGNQGLLALRRPFELIDGQHRTRGANTFQNSKSENSEELGTGYGLCKNDLPGHDSEEMCADECGAGEWISLTAPTRELIPFSITPFKLGGFERSAKARIFVDINTRAEDLAPNHKLTMLWRHSVEDGWIKDGEWNESALDFSDDNTEESLIYRLILELCRDVPAGTQQTKGRIPPLQSSTGPNLISVRSMRNHLKRWKDGGRVFSGYQSHTQTTQFAEVLNNYLRAWAWHFSQPIVREDNEPRNWTPSHPEYQDGHPYWDAAAGPGKAKKSEGGYLQVPVNAPDPEKMKFGEVNRTPLLHLIFELFDDISLSILKKCCEEDEEEWQDHLLNDSYSAIMNNRLSENRYRTEVKKFADKYGSFGEEPLTKGYLNNNETRKAFKRILCRKFGWS